MSLIVFKATCCTSVLLLPAAGMLVLEQDAHIQHHVPCWICNITTALKLYVVLLSSAAGMFALKQDVSVMGARAAFKKRVASGKHLMPNTSMQSDRSLPTMATPPPSFKSVRFR
jgi:hypothetical protein